jgi:DNA-binding NarL/FixJ family response regulator
LKKLTVRELEVVRLLAKGLDSKEVADELFVSKRTVDFHIAQIFDKLELEVRNRVNLLSACREMIA